MNQYRPVPGIARGPQGFAPRSLPPISNPMGQPPAMQQQQADDVSVVDELAMEIYCRAIAAEVITGMNDQHMREFAQQAKQAAAIFFEEQTNGQA